MTKTPWLLFFLSFLIFIGCEETCEDGILNQDETFVDCGGICPTCTTCVDGIQNGLELGIDCGGICEPCISCFDGIQNQGETGIDCGGPCDPCENCFDGILNQNESEADCGGVCLPCVPLCPSMSSSGITGNINYSFSTEYLNPIDSHSVELLNTGIQFHIFFEDSSEMELYHDYILFEVGTHNESILSTMEVRDTNGNLFLSSHPNSSVFFFINNISTDADCRIINGFLNGNLSIDSEEEEDFVFFNIEFSNFFY